MDEIKVIENNYLIKTIDAINCELKRRSIELETLPKSHIGDAFLLETLMSIAATRKSRLESIIDKPYFARIDFTPNDNFKLNECYIGKSSIVDEMGDDVVVDWRSPICSLYYDSNLGEVSYLAPMGEINGILSLKRQFIIDHKVIESIYDVDSVSDDELLKPYLKANADTRLKNIVASIQKEQNTIIRSPIFKNMIVEGVAGSGKTTVALHRIAYLVYNENARFKPSQFMIIGPNEFFLNYISSVLPDLESGDVNQITLEGVAESYLNEKITFVNNAQTLIDYISGRKDTTSLRFKQSLIYKDLLDRL
jgi:DNA helicase-2/ATP-dependent DNA helicase PcrA